MSSLPSTIILKSRTFRYMSLSTLVFIGAASILLWAITSATIHELENRIYKEITSELSWQQQLHAGRGIGANIDDIKIDDQPIWNENWVYGLMAEEEFVHALYDENGTIIAGSDQLSADPGWSEVTLTNLQNLHPLVAFHTSLEDKHQLIIAKFKSEAIILHENLRYLGTLFLLFLLLPVALLTAYVFSKRMFSRLEALLGTTRKVARGTLDKRAPISKQNDEFDELSLALNRMLDRLQSLNQNIKDVSIGIAHDLRIPLSNLAGRIAMIEQDIHDSDQVRVHLDVIDKRIKVMLEIFDALLRLGEIEAGQRKASFRVVDLSHLINDVAENYGPIFEDSEICLKTATQENIEISGDKDLLIQMITNLLENVIQHAHGAENAWLQLEATEQHIILTVCNDGVEIPSTMRLRIFERFVQLDQSRSSKGNGLGLSLVKAISELHDAEISVISQTGITKFEFAFCYQT